MGRRGTMSGTRTERPLRLLRSRPRSFAEWDALRRWGRLPEGERDVPGYLKRAGISQQAVSRAERWSSNPTVRLMRRWLAACGRRLRLDVEEARSP